MKQIRLKFHGTVVVNVLQSMFSFFLSSFVLLCCVLRFLFFCFFTVCLFVCFNNLRCKKLYLRLNDNPLNPLKKLITFLSYFILFICFLNNVYVSV